MNLDHKENWFKNNSTQTFAQMSVDAHVPSSASEALVFSVGYVFVGHRVDIFFRQPKI